MILVGGVSAVSARAADASLAGIHWRLVSIGGTAADLSRREPFILLDASGQISGGTGCNRFAGGYVVDGAYLTFGQVATTRMYCADGVGTGAGDPRRAAQGGAMAGDRRPAGTSLAEPDCARGLPGGAGRELSGRSLRLPASPSIASSRS